MNIKYISEWTGSLVSKYIANSYILVMHLARGYFYATQMHVHAKKIRVTGDQNDNKQVPSSPTRWRRDERGKTGSMLFARQIILFITLSALTRLQIESTLIRVCVPDKGRTCAAFFFPFESIASEALLRRRMSTIRTTKKLLYQQLRHLECHPHTHRPTIVLELTDPLNVTRVTQEFSPKTRFCRFLSFRQQNMLF